ncbi:MAG: DUF1836 domain-containing protein [Lachnospiraceae bacterium]|nr:DUF1836 domain-containing protein [Lachnospiraceae bacterium]MBR4060543.1 DUF1836 domain-containing protein [Lachnospiraceae bacterium]
MTIDTENLLESIMQSLERFDHIKSKDIPNMDLYMDQVTTLMEENLASAARHGNDDKILTKTMINNYAKNDLLPAPIKKKYSKEHILVLILIYYFKGILSIGDIQKLFAPLNEHFFANEGGLKIEDIYDEVFSMEKSQMEVLKQDVVMKYKLAQEQFAEAPEEHQRFLKKFAFICALSFDVYVKKLIIEKLIDDLPDINPKKK